MRGKRVPGLPFSTRVSSFSKISLSFGSFVDFLNRITSFDIRAYILRETKNMVAERSIKT